MNRRSFITGMAGILAAGVAPAVLSQGVIMPIRDIWTPPKGLVSLSVDFAKDGGYGVVLVHRMVNGVAHLIEDYDMVPIYGGVGYFGAERQQHILNELVKRHHPDQLLINTNSSIAVAETGRP